MKISIAAGLLALLLTPAIGCGQDQSATGEQVYRKACAACHDTGLMGAPKPGDKTAWASRMEAGKDAIYHKALHGVGAMPAKGGHSELSEAEVKEAVDFMLSKSR